MRWVFEELSKRSLSLLLSSTIAMFLDPGPYLIVLKSTFQNCVREFTNWTTGLDIVALMETKDEGAEIISTPFLPFLLAIRNFRGFHEPVPNPNMSTLANDIRSLLRPLRPVPPHERIGIRNEESFFLEQCCIIVLIFSDWPIDSYLTTLFTLPRPLPSLSPFYRERRGYQRVSTSRPLFSCNPHLTHSLPRRASLSLRNHLSSSPPLPVYSVERRTSTQYMP